MGGAVFKTVERQSLSLVGSIPIRLRHAPGFLLITVLTGLSLAIAGIALVAHAHSAQAKPHVEAIFCSRC